MNSHEPAMLGMGCWGMDEPLPQLKRAALKSRSATSGTNLGITAISCLARAGELAPRQADLINQPAGSASPLSADRSRMALLAATGNYGIRKVVPMLTVC